MQPRVLTDAETARARRATVRALRLRAAAADKAGDYIAGDALREWADSLARPRRSTPDYAWGMEPARK